MAVGLLIEIPGGTQQQYDAVMDRLDLARPDAIWPEGILCHVAGPMEGGWRVVDVWQSQEHFDRFFREKLEQAIREVGVPPFQPKTFPVHNLHR